MGIYCKKQLLPAVPLLFSHIARRTVRFSVLATIVSLLFPSVSLGQIEEVVVTAQKREESLQDVPIAIDALAGDQLDALGVYDTDDIVNLYPNLSLQGASTLNSGFTIRGVGTNNYHITGQQAVGQYIDEVTLVSPFTSQFGVFDMERIEILRGPQNTLFGRNTTGGAVNYISRKPEVGAGFNGFGRLKVGNEERVDFEGAVGFPLGGTAAGRIAFSSNNRGPVFNNLYIDPVTGPAPDLGEIERHSGRIQLLWEPLETTSVLLNGHVGYNRGDRGVTTLASGLWDEAGPHNVNTTTGVMDYATAKATGATIISPVIDCPERDAGIAQFEGVNNCVVLVPRSGGAVTNPSTSDWNDVYDAMNPVADVDLEGFFVKITHEFASIEFNSLTTYDEVSIEFPNQNSTVPHGTGFTPGQSGTWDVFSQEIRLVSLSEGPLRWILGGFYSTEDDRLATIIYRTDDGAPPFGLVPSISIDQDVEIWSVYGQAEYDVTQAGTITLGLRYTDDSKTGLSVARVAAYTDTGTPAGTPFPLNTYLTLDDYDRLTTPPSGPCPPPVGGFPCRLDIPVRQDLEEFGWKVGYDHNITDNILGYVSYSRGFKSGAFDTRALAAFSGTADKPVAPETLDAYEAGIKTSLREGRIEFNGAVFFYDWEDLQVFDVDASGAPAFLNVPTTEIYGLELELKWAPGDGWYAQAGLGYLHTEITDDGGLTTVAEGSVLQNSPEWSFNGLIQKEFPIGNNTLTLQTDFSYRDEFNSSLDEASFSWIDSTFFLNTRASFFFGSERQYEVSLWAENLTEEKTCSSIDTLGVLTYQMECANPNPGIVFYGATLAVNF